MSDEVIALGDDKDVMSRENSDDNVTDQQLRLLVGLVAVLGLFAVAGFAAYAIALPGAPPHPFVLAGLCGCLFIAKRVKVLVRVRANNDSTTWGEIPVLVGLTLIPAPWVVFCAIAAMTLLRCLKRVDLQKSVFGVAKEALTTSSAAAVFLAFGVRPDLTDPPFPVLPIVVALITFFLVDLLVFVPVLVTATGDGVLQVALRNWTGNVICLVGELATALLVVGVLATGTNPLLLLSVPLVVLCMHLWQSRSVRTREERESWQRLAKATDELNAVDLTQVLHSATTRAAQIFSAAESAIDLAGRTVRATASQVLADGTGPTDRVTPPDETSVDLIAHDGSVRVGVLRLRFGGTVRLTEVEQYKISRKCY